ncbi:MAG: YfcE family phosphodiesterase [Leptothrix sp. (in: Bacteria)]|nr:YfcE family phosphodiesterase [Leptothrix sp. (in: b-proteobacteria)]
MRIAVVSDIHGNLPALEAVLDEMAQAQLDLTVNLGDIVSGPLWPRETTARLRALGWPTIRGNHERQLLAAATERMAPADAFARARLDDDDLQWLAGLPATLDLGGGVWCCHGTPWNDLQYFLETAMPGLGRHGSRGVRAATANEVTDRLGTLAAPLVLCGHTHMPRALQCGPTLVVNPGSVGLPAFDDNHLHPHHMETGSPHARWAIVERGPRGWQVQQRLTAYDWEAAAQRAESNGRGDWADALRTGRVGRTEPDPGLAAARTPAGQGHAGRRQK